MPVTDVSSAGRHDRPAMDWLRSLDRIGETRSEPTLETLRRLQRRAMRALPFENLDIHLGRVIDLDLSSLYEKVLRNRRGGFCYELNECFYQCLSAMGYEVDRMEARVELRGPGSPFDHQWTLVRLNGSRWMTDIGMGDSAVSPLDLDDPEPQTDGRSWFRVQEANGYVEVLRQLEVDEWTKILTLNLNPHPWESFKDRCHYQQTSADSVFVHKRMCTVVTENGRITLAGNTLRKVGERTSEMRISERDYTRTLEDYFGISLSAPTWIRPIAQ